MRTPDAVLAEVFRLDAALQLSLRFNIAPTQDVAVVRSTANGRELSQQRWGFFPSWEKQPERARPLINARDDGLTKKRSFFKSSFQKRRCLIPSDGFYEWKKIDKKTKHPYYVRLRDDRPFAYAGLWTSWNEIETCTIITTGANEIMEPLHDRMPVILQPNQLKAWLEPTTSPDELQKMTSTYPTGQMEAYPVSSLVNSPRNNCPECLEKQDILTQEELF